MKGWPALVGLHFLFLALASHAPGAQKVYSHGNPSSHEQLMLELINRARSTPGAEAKRHGISLNRGLSSGRISAVRKPPLAFNRHLIAAARDHSRWMLDTGIFSHKGAGGSSPSQRAQARGFAFGAAENIERASDSKLVDRKVQARAAHSSLFRSAGHRLNLMDPTHTVAGIGMLFARGGLNQRRTTQKFGSDVTAESGPFIVGVAFDDRNRSNFYDPGEGLRGIKVRPSRGSHYAVTSSSGGFAIPIRPMAVRPGFVIVNLPFAVNQTGSWEKARKHDLTFRAAQIARAPEIDVKLTWTGPVAGLPVERTLKIKRPERVNYRLTGTDGYFFQRSMITCPSVKTDLIFSGGKSRTVVR